jgi:hypothetical protein
MSSKGQSDGNLVIGFIWSNAFSDCVECDGLHMHQ